MDIGITAIGTANPSYKAHQLETVEVVAAGLNLTSAEKRLLKSVYKATGIDYRHSVLSDYCKMPGDFEFFPNEPHQPYPSTEARMQVYKKNALNLALAAIQNAATDLEHITHLITVSCTGMYAPGIDIEIIQQLQLDSTIKRTAVNFMGCYGAFNAIKLAHSICKAEPKSKVLIVCVELCTIHFQKKFDMDNLIANAIFADGAAAVIIEANPQQNKYFQLNSFYCDLLPQTSQEMAWTIADTGFDIVLSTYVPEVIESGISIFIDRLLDQYHFNIKDIDLFAIHPGGLKILQACEKALDITVEQNKYSYDVLRHYGNMSSATVLFVLQKIWGEMETKDHDKRIYSCAFGPGLTLESMLLKVYCC